MIHRNEKGFTVVEIIIVIVIVGIIAALSVPVFVNLQDEAKAKSEQSTVGAIRSGIHNYYMQSKMTDRTPLYPETLDDAGDGSVSAANQFFTNVLSASQIYDWDKNALSYTGPTGTVYTYNPAMGTFESGIGLVYKWGMNEGTGNTIGEGAYLGQMDGDVQWVEGKVGTALQFDGQGSYVRIEDSDALDLTTAGTLEAWIYADSLIPNYCQGIIHKGDKANFSDEAYSLQFWSGTSVALIVNYGGGSNYSLIQSGTQLIPNQWYHVVGTWDETGMSIYINGALNASNSTKVAAQSSAGDLYIGAQISETYSSYYHNLPFDGIIDEAQIYDRALGADEVASYYNSTK